MSQNQGENQQWTIRRHNCSDCVCSSVSKIVIGSQQPENRLKRIRQNGDWCNANNSWGRKFVVTVMQKTRKRRSSSNWMWFNKTVGGSRHRRSFVMTCWFSSNGLLLMKTQFFGRKTVVMRNCIGMAKCSSSIESFVWNDGIGRVKPFDGWFCVWIV